MPRKMASTSLETAANALRINSNCIPLRSKYSDSNCNRFSRSIELQMIPSSIYSIVAQTSVSLVVEEACSPSSSFAAPVKRKVFGD